MASINFEKKIIYIHIPKTAGSYIQYILMKNYNCFSYNCCSYEYRKISFSYKEYPLVKYFSRPDILEPIGINIDELSSYKKFTFVRNPYNRFISAWEFLIEKDFLDEEITFEELIINKDTYDSLVYNHLFVTQSEHMKGWDFDEIGQFETLEQDLKCILSGYGFKITHEETVKNKTINKKDISFYFNNSNFIEFINSYFDEDFLNFGYEKMKLKNDL